MELDTQSLSVPALSTAVMESTTFRLRISTGDPFEQQRSVAHYNIVYDNSIRHPVLQYQFVTQRKECPYDDDQSLSYYSQKQQVLSDRLDELTLIELTKIAPDNRPMQHAQVARDLSGAATTRSKFDLPATWTYYDEEVIAYLDKAWKIQLKIDQSEERLRKACFHRDILNATWKKR